MPSPEPSEDLIAMRVGGIVVDPRTEVPVIVLRGVEEPRLYLPIFIGGLEATAIATVLAEVELPRPMSHDLMATMLTELGCRVRRVTVTELVEGTFFAEITLVDGFDRELAVDARPSDGIALALRVSAPIFVAKGVVVEAGAMSEEPAAEGAQDPTEVGDLSAIGSEGEGEAAEEAPGAPPKAKGEGSAPAPLLDVGARLEDLEAEDFGKYKM